MSLRALFAFGTDDLDEGSFRLLVVVLLVLALLFDLPLLFVVAVASFRPVGVVVAAEVFVVFAAVVLLLLELVVLSNGAIATGDEGGVILASGFGTGL